MQPEILKVSVIQGKGGSQAAIAGVLENCSQLQVLGQDCRPEDFLGDRQPMAPDLLIVNLDNGNTLPPWLEELTQCLPHTAVMVWSHNQERDFLIRAMQSGVRELLPLPLVKEDLEAALDRVRTHISRRRQVGSETSAGQMVAVTGLKGGVGTTAIAVNLAAALAEMRPHRVVLVDLGRPFPNVAKFLDLKAKNDLQDLMANSAHLDPPFVLKTLQPHKTGLAVLHGCSEFKDYALIDPQLLKKVWTILRSMFDWIVVDLSFWPDDLYLQVFEEADQMLFITQLMVPDLQNLKRLWELLQQAGVDRGKIKVVVNRYRKGNGLELQDLEKIQRQPVFFTLPSDFPALGEAINHGEPLTAVAPRSKLTRGLQQLAMELEKQVSAAAAGEAQGQSKTRRRFLFF